MSRQSRLQLWRQARYGLHLARCVRRPSPVRCFVLSLGRRHAQAFDKPPEQADDGEMPLRFPDPPSMRHSDLASFLDHARRTGLDEKSTVYVGTHYEYTVADALTRHGFLLRRVGGASDRGTDLVGTWTLPSVVHPLRVLVQCKAGTQRVGPQHVRELEGAFIGAPVGWRGRGVLGLLVSEQAATKGVRDSLCRSKWPMAFACCSRIGALSQMLWNHSAEEQGLLGFGVSVKHTQDQTPKLVLTRNGKAVG